MYIGVAWEVRNTSKKPSGYSWENKYLMDKEGRFFSPFKGIGVELIQPGFESGSGLITYYRIPNTVSDKVLVWGLYNKDDSNLKYEISLNPVAFPKNKCVDYLSLENAKYALELDNKIEVQPAYRCFFELLFGIRFGFGGSVILKD